MWSDQASLIRWETSWEMKDENGSSTGKQELVPSNSGSSMCSLLGPGKGKDASWSKWGRGGPSKAAGEGKSPPQQALWAIRRRLGFSLRTMKGIKELKAGEWCDSIEKDWHFKRFLQMTDKGHQCGSLRACFPACYLLLSEKCDSVTTTNAVWSGTFLSILK